MICPTEREPSADVVVADHITAYWLVGKTSNNLRHRCGSFKGSTVEGTVEE